MQSNYANQNELWRMFVIVAIKIHLMYFDLCISTHTQKYGKYYIFKMETVSCFCFYEKFNFSAHLAERIMVEMCEMNGRER